MRTATDNRSIAACPDWPGPSLEVVRFDQRNARCVSRMIERSMQAAFPLHYTPAVIRQMTRSLTPEKLTEAARRGTTLMALRRGRVVGTGTLIGDWIYAVYVDPPSWRAGAGRALMKALEQEACCQRLRKVGLFSSTYALAFYERLGYRRHRTWDDAQGPAIEMYKSLGGKP